MADPLSVAGSVVGLISLGIEVSDRLVQFYSSVKDSRQDVQSARAAIEELRIILTSIQSAIEARRGRLSPDEVKLVESSVLSCQGCIERLERKLNKIQVASGPEVEKSSTQSNSVNPQPTAGSTETPSVPSRSKPGWARAVRNVIKDSKGRLQYPFMESTLAKLRETIGEIKENLILSLQVLNISNAASIFTVSEKLDGIQSGIWSLVAEGNKARTAKLVSWLFSTDVMEIHREALKQIKDPETGGWLLQSETLKDWKQEPGSLCWLHGMAGCGKTVLMASVVERLRNLDPAYALVCVYYFRFDDARRRTFNEFIKSLVFQCSLADPEYSTQLLEPFYADHGHGTCEPGLDVLLSLLKNLLLRRDNNQQQCYIAVDALDECSDISLFCEWITDVRLWRFDTVHLLLTSRVLPRIQEVVEQKLSRGTNISFENEKVDLDIARHVEHILQNDSKLCRFPEHLKTEIKTSLVEGAKGMFRWAACMIKVIKECPNMRSVKKLIRQLPPDLDTVYEKMLTSVDPIKQDILRAILLWVAFCQEPLREEELIEAAAIDLEEIREALSSSDPTTTKWIFKDPPQLLNPPFTPENRLFHSDRNLEGLCPGVLVRVPGTFIHWDKSEGREVRKETTYIKLAHYSIMEYLVSDRILQGSAARFSITPTLAHVLISAGCAAYLHYVGTELGPTIVSADHQRLEEYPLFRYAASTLFHILADRAKP